MTYGDFCTGISAATVAWHPLGWRPAYFSEIERFPCRVLQYHYPHVPNLGDMLNVHKNKFFNESDVDLFIAGTPCQSFSLAGLRTGLDDSRGNLAIGFCRLLILRRPRWFVWENVPGVLSSFSGESDDGVPVWQTSDFATLLLAFQECGYSVAWRVLDSQYFGVPQRRDRVFVVGYLGDDWRPPAAVLFEPESSTRNTSSIHRPGETIAGTLTSRTKAGGFPGTDEALSGYIQPCWWDGGQLSQTLDAVLSKGQPMPEKNRFPAILQPLYFESRIARNGRGNLDTVAAALKAQAGGTGKGDSAGMILNDIIVRRLTPRECERLQGFPDDYTAIPGASDGARYKALGNSMTTLVMRWIGKRIDFVDKLLQQTR